MANRACIGKTYLGGTYHIGWEKTKEYAQSVGDLNSLYHNAEDGKKAGYGGAIAPPMFAAVYAKEVLGTAMLDPDLQINLARLVHGEQEFEFHQVVKPGDIIATEGRIADVYEKTKDGKNLDFVVLETTSKNQKGELVTKGRWTFVIRGEQAATQPAAQAPAAAPTVTPDQLTCKMILEAMPSRFNPEGAANWNTVVQFNFSGEKGGNWYVTIKDKTCTVIAGTAEKPTATLNTSADTWIGIITGKVRAEMAFMSGQLKIQGNMGDIMKLNNPAVFRRV